MSYDKDISEYFPEFASDQPIKRVRFSDEIKNVYEYEYEDGHSSRRNTTENDREILSSELKFFDIDEIPNNDSMACAASFGNSTDTTYNDQCMYECDEEIDELIECNKKMSISCDSGAADSYPQIRKSGSSNVLKYPQSDYFDNNNSDMADLNLLIQETKHMKISVPEQVQEKSQHLFSETFQMHPSSYSKSKKSVLTAAAQPIERNIGLENRKRTLSEMQADRQTSKLNSCLRIYDAKVDSAVYLKNAVFNAWNKVKAESAKVECATDVYEAKEKSITLPKSSPAKFEYIKDARPIKSARKSSIKEAELLFQKRQQQIEESKLAFFAWKKKKDDLLMQQLSEERNVERQKKLDCFKNDRKRKRNAETAFLSWVSHKAAVAKLEKKKSQWLLERENEKLNEKIKRNEEADKMYYEWLKNKIFSKKQNNQITEDKPPWTPPGKANILF